YSLFHKSNGNEGSVIKDIIFYKYPKKLYHYNGAKSIIVFSLFRYRYCQVIVGNFLFDLSFLFKQSFFWFLIPSHIQQSFSLSLYLSIQSNHMSYCWILIALSIFLWC